VIRSALFTLLLLLPVANLSAQDWARKMFVITDHDFGSVARGAKAEFGFKFSNLYKEEVHISGVRSSCGCTTPRVSKDDLKTYEEAEIIAAFNTRSFQGQKSATVTVTIDKPYYAEVQLHVSGYIRTDIVLTPGSVEIGTVDRGATAEKKITVNYAGRDDWKIVDVKPNSPFVQATVTETKRGGGSVGYELTVRLKPDAPLGYLKDQITLVTNDQKGLEVPVDVEARIVAEVTVSPASLFLGVLQPGQKVTKQLVVQGKKPFRITAITCKNESFQFQVPDTLKSVHLVPVTFIAGEKSGKLTTKIHIETDLGPGAVPDLSAYAQVMESEKKVADAKP
jgi:hypothetical protein